MKTHARNTKQRAGVVAVLCLGAVTLALGCDGEHSTMPGARPLPVRPRIPEKPSAVVYEAAGDASLGLGSSDVSPILSVPLPQFTYPTLVRVTALGTMSTTLTEFNDGGPGSPPAPGAPRTFGPGGYFWGTSSYNGCGTAIYVYYSQGDAWSPGCAENRSTDTVVATTAHIYVGGLGSASRTVPAPATSGQNGLDPV
jgi:hypothetical protein